MAQKELHKARERAEFWECIDSLSLNQRQKMMLHRLLDGLAGTMTTVKGAHLCRCSHDTAGRDISALVNLDLVRKGSRGGRSTWYELAWLRKSNPSLGEGNPSGKAAACA